MPGSPCCPNRFSRAGLGKGTERGYIASLGDMVVGGGCQCHLYGGDIYSGKLVGADSGKANRGAFDAGRGAWNIVAGLGLYRRCCKFWRSGNAAFAGSLFVAIVPYAVTGKCQCRAGKQRGAVTADQLQGQLASMASEPRSDYVTGTALVGIGRTAEYTATVRPDAIVMGAAAGGVAAWTNRGGRHHATGNDGYQFAVVSDQTPGQL